MKKLLLIVVLIFIFSNKPSEAERTIFVRGAVHEGAVYWTSRIKIDLPPGKWTVIDKFGWQVKAVEYRGVALAQVKNNVLDSYFEIDNLDGNGKWIAHVVEFVRSQFFANQYDGCYQRPEYYLVKVKKSGGFFNCFKIRHEDTEKLLFAPDDKRRKTATSFIRKYFRDNNIEVPKIMLSRYHGFLAASVKDSYYGIFYVFNPETHGAPKNKFFTEDSSEYHRANINNFPKKKKYIEDFIISAAYEHKKFEKIVRARPRHLLNFSEYNIEEISKKTTTASGSQLTEQLKALKQLYDDGVLTKEEFTKAKKKILN